MAIKKEPRANKFDNAIAELNAEEDIALEKSEKIVKAIAGKKAETRIIVDKTGRKREMKVPEHRKALSVYIPESLYEEFSEVNRAYGMSNNGAICQLIREYVIKKHEVLK